MSTLATANNLSPMPDVTRFDIQRTHIQTLAYPQNGSPAHFLHANGLCAGTYHPFLAHLQGVLALSASDLPGHGRSGPPAEDPIRHWRTFVPDLRELIVNQFSPPLFLIGHSLGAVVAYLIAAQHPELVQGLVMIDPVIFPRRFLLSVSLMRRLGLMKHFPIAKKARRRKYRFASREEAAERFLNGKGMFKTWDQSFIQAYLDCALEYTPEACHLRCHPETEAQIFSSVPSDVWRYAPDIKCPVLLLRGARSDTFSEEAAQKLNKKIGNCRLLTISGTTHFLPMEKPDRCAGAILNFISQTTT